MGSSGATLCKEQTICVTQQAMQTRSSVPLSLAPDVHARVSSTRLSRRTVCTHVKPCGL